MALVSYFFDSSIDGDRRYSARDFSRAFGIVLENGVLRKENGKLGLDIGGTNNTSIYNGKAVVEGHLIEIVGSEYMNVPAGSYSGQIVLQVDIENERKTNLIVKQERSPVQTSSLYELPLYNVGVVNGIISTIEDIRYQGGAVPTIHTHHVSDISEVNSILKDSVTWLPDPNGVKCNMGKFGGTGKPVVLYLTSNQPSPSSTEHRVWIQIDKF
jgi:hypothetical protein